MKLKSAKIIELEKKLQDIRNRNLKLNSQSPANDDDYNNYVDFIERVETELAKENKEWEEYLNAMKISEINRFCLRFKNDKLEVLIEQSNGRYIFSDGTLKINNDIYIFLPSNWSKVLKELENLINKNNLKESELQSFFEEHPELVLDDKYEFPIPQATIINDTDIEWRADFVLVPKDQLTFAKILEIKLPTEKISNISVNGHSRFSAKLYQAINQLKDYYSAFDSEKTKSRFKEKYNTDIFKPDLQLLFGRKSSIKSTTSMLELQRRENVSIRDWDSLLEDLKKKFL